MHSLTSDVALAMDITELAELVSEGPFTYHATQSELLALQWLAGRYTVVEVLLEAVQWNEALHIDPIDVAEALADEGLDRVPCLSEDTALARIVWAIGPIPY